MALRATLTGKELGTDRPGQGCWRPRCRRRLTPSSRRADAAASEEWSPPVTIGAPVPMRDAYGVELTDRFGLPAVVGNLLKIIAIERTCHEAAVERTEAGPNGAEIRASPTRRGSLVVIAGAAVPLPTPSLVKPKVAKGA